MPSNRIGRINEEVMRELARLLPTVKDPRLGGGLLSIVRCEVTNDLRWCKVYLSTLGQFDMKELKKGLKSCSGYLRRELAHSLSLRFFSRRCIVCTASAKLSFSCISPAPFLFA